MQHSVAQAHHSRLLALRENFGGQGVDGVIIPRFDAHQGEVCAPHDERLAYITGFRGSAGIALVTGDDAVIFVDGRYQIQVRNEVDLTLFTVSHFYDAPIEAWLEKNAKPGQRFGFNPMLIPTNLFERLRDALAKAGGELVPLTNDPVDAIWGDQPEPPLGPITPFPMTFSGETSASKRGRIAEALKKQGADLLVETQPDNIAWLLNVRGSDVAYNPTPHSFLLLDSEGVAEWFVDERKLPNDRSDMDENVAIATPSRFLERIGERAKGRSVIVDPAFASVAAKLAVDNAGGKVVAAISPITTTKANKNDVELAGFRDAHIEDGVAWTEFLAWLHAEGTIREDAGNPITELEAEEQILAFRRERKEFVEPSFNSISASSANAAMCHYSSSPASNTAITNQGIYLLDSGGQYRNGTTDATRTTALGQVSEEVRLAYTAVLKGFISLMSVQFPIGTKGHQLDALARRPLWDMGLDYDHGTGHGVGHFLSVHEHPHRFGKAVNPYAIEPGVVMTVEPGYYKDGAYGIRIENQIETVAGQPGFLRFETLTLVPINLALAEIKLLTREEKVFLNLYHARVQRTLAPLLSPRARAFLDTSTQAIIV